MSQENRFHFKFVRGFFTYKTHIDKDKIRKFFSQKGEIVSFFVAHEKEDEKNEYEHSHVVVEFLNCFDKQSPGAREFDYEGIHPFYEAVRYGKQNWDRVLDYIAKEDPSLADIKKSNKLKRKIMQVQECKDLTETFNLIDNIQEAHSVKLIWEARQQKRIKLSSISSEALYPWQKEAFHIIETNDDYKIYWIYDTIGHNGKTTFCKYAEETLEDVIVLNGVGSYRDVATTMEEYNNKTIRVIINVSKDADLTHFYEAIEYIRDGMMTSQKFRGKLIRIKVLSMLVLSNSPPIQAKLSAARWIIYSLESPSLVARNNINSVLPSSDLGDGYGPQVDS